MFEAAFATAATLAPEEQQPSLGLQGAAISAPLLLKPPGSGSHMLHMAVQLRTGAVQLSSASSAVAGRPGQPTSHLAATAVWMPAVALEQAQAAAPPQPSIFSALAAQRFSQAVPAAWQGEACGSVSQAALQPASDCYHCHPAAVDAATHFGAAFDVAGSAAARVPVALGCYSAAAAPAGELSAAASAGRLLADGSRVSSFALWASGAAKLSLAALQSRPTGAQPVASATPALTAAAEQLAANCCSYELAWQAADPVQSAAASSCATTPALALETDAGMRWRAAPAAARSLPRAALNSYGAALRMLRTLRPGMQARLSATLSGAGQQAPPSWAPVSSQPQPTAGAAAVAGLLKVAALEEPAWQLQLVQADARSSGAPAAMPAADAHGVAAAGAACFLPRMQLGAAQPSVSSANQQEQRQLAGCHVISGGLGGLGELTASHLAQQAQQDSRLLLLGRTGRFSSTSSASQQQLLRTAGCVVLLQCDLAAAADAAGIAAQLAAGGVPAASFVHAAGTLADGLLASQRLSDARRVFAPKVSGLASVLPALQRQPCQSLLLFSSVSAALGNRGQANYAAANAVLDGAAAALSAVGCAATSLQLGAWAGAGMAASTPQLLGRLKKQGVCEEGLRAVCSAVLRCRCARSPPVFPSLPCRPGRHPA